MSKYGVFSGPHFPAFGPNTAYSVRMRENTGQKNPVFGHFSRSDFVTECNSQTPNTKNQPCILDNTKSTDSLAAAKYYSKTVAKA